VRRAAGPRPRVHRATHAAAGTAAQRRRRPAHRAPAG
jgi:hypothetical protein